jgi:hypothetical protein
MLHRHPKRPEPWALAAGAAAGAGAVAFAVLQGVRLLRRRQARHEHAPTVPAELATLEEAAVALLRQDRATDSCAIDVAAIAPGIIELTGVVPSHEVGQRAARILHSLSGVRTVISRLEVGSFEARLAEARGRRARGEPETQERHWYGVRVGTGRRRQSADTEPARDDDSLERRSRELDVQPTDLTDAAATGPIDTTERPM